MAVVHCSKDNSEMKLERYIDYERYASPFIQHSYSVEYVCLVCNQSLNIGLDGGEPTLFLKSEEQISEYFDEKIKICVDCKKQYPIQRNIDCNNCNGKLKITTRLLV